MRTRSEDVTFAQYFLTCSALVGAVAFWGLLFYRIYVEGLGWIWKTNDGIAVAGVICLSGFYMFSAELVRDKVEALPSDLGHMVTALALRIDELAEDAKDRHANESESLWNKMRDIRDDHDGSRRELTEIQEKLDRLLRQL